MPSIQHAQESHMCSQKMFNIIPQGLKEARLQNIQTAWELKGYHASGKL
jgi:hypothetical protein